VFRLQIALLMVINTQNKTLYLNDDEPFYNSGRLFNIK